MEPLEYIVLFPLKGNGTSMMSGVKVKLSGFQSEIESTLDFLKEKYEVIRASKFKQSDLPGEVHIYVVLMLKVVIQ
jgi:hypothetical protein